MTPEGRAEEIVNHHAGADLKADIAAALCAEGDRKLEEAANAADEYALEKWRLYKTGHGPERGSDYTQGQADGADEVATIIRAFKENP